MSRTRAARWAGCSSALVVLVATGLGGAQPANELAPPRAPEPSDETVDLTEGGEPGPELGQPPSEREPSPVQRNFSFGPRLRFGRGYRGFSAVGMGLRAGHPYFGVHFSGGYQALYPDIERPGDEEPIPELFHSWHMSLLGYVAFNPDAKAVVGVTGGYRYSGTLGRGIMLAFELIEEQTEHVCWQLNVGNTFYPDGEDRLRDKEDIPASAEVVDSMSFQLTFGLGLVIYP